jgi:hypothetical protein
MIVVLVGVAAAVLLDPNRRRAVAYVALAFAGALLLFRLSDGLSFLPGMLVTSPFAVAGVIAATRDARLRPVAAIAIGALPLVFLFQYPDGANAQWGGRYLLAPGALLGVVGIVALLGRGTRPFVAFGIAAVLVTGCGVAWLSERSHVVADSAAVLASRDPVMTIGLPHQLREWGAFYDPAAPRLTMDEPGDRGSALGILDATRATHFTVVARTARQAPEHLGDYERVSARSIEFLSGIRFTVAEYTRT